MAKENKEPTGTAYVCVYSINLSVRKEEATGKTGKEDEIYNISRENITLDELKHLVNNIEETTNSVSVDMGDD